MICGLGFMMIFLDAGKDSFPLQSLIHQVISWITAPVADPGNSKLS